MAQLAPLLPAVDSDRGWRLRRLPHAVPFGFHGNWLEDAEMVTGWCTRLSGGPDPVGGGGHAADGRSRDWRAFRSSLSPVRTRDRGGTSALERNRDAA